MKNSSLLLLSLTCSFWMGCPSTPADPDAGDGPRDAPAADAGPADAGPGDAPSNDTPTPLDAGPPNGTSCGDDGECGSGHCVDGVCCDTACDGVCVACAGALTGGTDGVCDAVLAADPEDECADEGCTTGACGDGACELRPLGFECRAVAGECDVAERCDGASAACPVDALLPAETLCRASAGECDVAEACTGGSAACPADERVPSGASCRVAADVCDLEETCDGVSVACPTDVFVPQAGSLGLCGAYLCSGAAAACPASCDGHEDCAAGSVCGGGTCRTGWRMFVTSTSHAASFGTGADGICQARASAAGLSGRYRAWVSYTTASASARLYHPTSPIYRMDGTTPRIIANDWADLVDGISVAVATDEYGNPHRDAHVWTGTYDDGTGGAANCSNWTSTSGSGMTGNSSAAAFSTYFGPDACSQSYRLYCLEQPPPS